jgi:hypothetical protein
MGESATYCRECLTTGAPGLQLDAICQLKRARDNPCIQREIRSILPTPLPLLTCASPRPSSAGAAGRRPRASRGCADRDWPGLHDPGRQGDRATQLRPELGSLHHPGRCSPDHRAWHPEDLRHSKIAVTVEIYTECSSPRWSVSRKSRIAGPGRPQGPAHRSGATVRPALNNHFGIWLSQPVTAHGLGTNVFANVNAPISAGH